MQVQAFDREYALAELLAGIDACRLLGALERLLEARACLVTPDGELVAGDAGVPANAPHATVRGELEPLGELRAQASAPRLRAAADLLEILLRTAARYHMASDLHLETVQGDYEELQHRHAALQESEARYRELAENLERRVAEQVETIEVAQRRLYESEKLVAVGQLAAGVAHEINNPIGFVQSNLGTALDYLGQLTGLLQQARDGVAGAELEEACRRARLDFVMQDFAELLRESRGGVQRVARIVADLREFSRIDSAGTEDADINALIRSMCNVTDSQVRERADVVLEPGELPPLHCHAGHIGQLLLNLLLNAVQAMTRRGTIRIGTARVDDAIRITVTDDGAGIPADVLPRIFDPFFTTRPVGQGTGLGLAVCNDIARAHGGRIEVESEPGKGSRFTVTLPLTHA